MPWIAELDAQEGHSGEAQKGGASGSAEGGLESGKEESDEEEEDLMQTRVMAALDKAREALAKESTLTFDDFRTTVLGGQDLMQRTGKTHDNVIGMARGKAAEEFCKRHHEPYSFRASIATYGEKGASILCRAWCHRAQYYYDAERKHFLGQGLVFSEVQHKDYQEPPELLAYLAKPECSQAFRKRVESLREFMVV
eukprot:10051442-Lingulodinium_polyedra.AAC.1